MTRDGYPSLFQINTRVWLTELSRVLGRPATLNDVPDVELDRLDRLRERLRKRTLKLMLDFVPNHTGLDHPASRITPTTIVGTERDVARAPGNDGWPDTLQLNDGNPALQHAMIEDLERTWSIRAEPFWPKATQRVRAKVKGFGKERLVAVVNDACFP